MLKLNFLLLCLKLTQICIACNSKKIKLGSSMYSYHSIITDSYRLEESLPARASEQGNVIGSVRIYIYIYMCVQKKIVIERTRDLNYLKFVATDFSPKTISPSAGENSGDLA